MTKQEQAFYAVSKVIVIRSRDIQSLMTMVVFVEGFMTRAERGLRATNSCQLGDLASSAWFSGWDDAAAQATC
jgi:hypothetical protein